MKAKHQDFYQHLVHHDCVKQKEFSCSIDRTINNGLLPNIDDLIFESIFADKNDLNRDVNSETLSDELKESLKSFIETYSKFIESQDDKIIDVFVELVKLISGIISTFEVRLRNLPDCLDWKKSIYLSRNLFLTTWYANKMKGKPKMKTGFEDDISEDVDSKLTIMDKYSFFSKIIGSFALNECKSLKKLTIPSSVTEIRNSAFSLCSSLTQVFILSSKTEILI